MPFTARLLMLWVIGFGTSLVVANEVSLRAGAWFVLFTALAVVALLSVEMYRVRGKEPCTPAQQQNRNIDTD